MKTIKILNLIAVGTPFFFAFLGIFDRDYFFWALISTMLTGGLQILISLALLSRFYTNQHLWIYLFGVVFFFIFMYFFQNHVLLILPPILCIYLTFTIYKISP